MNPNLIKEGAMHVIEKWHELVETGNKDIYDEILADDVVISGDPLVIRSSLTLSYVFLYCIESHF